MATKNAALRNLVADAFGDAFDSGTLKIYDSGNNLICTFTLAADAFGAAASGTVNLNSTPISDTAGATGIADHADLESNGGTYAITDLTVGESGTQIVLDNVDINSGQTVTLNSFSYTVPATVN